MHRYLRVPRRAYYFTSEGEGARRHGPMLFLDTLELVLGPAAEAGAFTNSDRNEPSGVPSLFDAALLARSIAPDAPAWWSFR